MYQRTGKINYAMEPNPLQPGTYSAIVQHDRKMDISYMVQNIAERTSLNNSTVQSVVLALVEEIGKEVANGNIVVVNGLVSFRAALHVPPHTTDPEYEITPDNANLSIDTRPLPEIKNEVETRASYKRVAHVEK
ncbi:MAG: hypothetical protein DRR19_21870 [Candidatus Parabeggiatoa sp. nov. 1]|nr:MAG: hypothetical protein DRR19_21870 [Gammaproteobacteria bacterium]